MIKLEDHADGVVLPVRARAGARDNCLRGEQNGALRVAVTQSPEKGKANKAIIHVLSKALQLRRSQIELLTGQTNNQKRFLVRGVSRSLLVERIARAVGT